MPKKKPETMLTSVVTRPARTGGQFSFGWAITALIAAFVTLTPEQYAAILTFSTLVVGTAQVALENRGIIPALFRKVPPKKEPLVDEGFALLSLIGAILLIVGAVFLVAAALGHHPHFNPWAAVIAGIGLVLLWFDGGGVAWRRRR